MTNTKKVVLVTGCSSGIGHALSLELARRGHQVFATARNPASLSALTAAGITALRLDVTDPASVQAAVDEVIASRGRIDVLVNNAGLNLIGPLAEVPLAEVAGMFETNVLGLLAVTQAVFPQMARQHSGRIVNIGSVVGLLPTPFAGPYCATKAAVHQLSEVLRMEAAPFGIDVVVVQPGGVQSRISENGARDLGRYDDPASLYYAARHGIAKRAQSSQDRAMDTDTFARQVVDAALAHNAPRVVRKGRGARVYPALSRLPGVLRDRVLSQVFKLDALRQR